MEKMSFEEFEMQVRKALFKRTDATRAVLTLSVVYDADVFGEIDEETETKEIKETFKESYGLNVSFATVLAAIAGDEEARKAVRRGKLLGVFDYKTMHFLELTPDFRLVPSDFSEFVYRLYLTKAALENADAFCTVEINFEVSAKTIVSTI